MRKIKKRKQKASFIEKVKLFFKFLLLLLTAAIVAVIVWAFETGYVAQKTKQAENIFHTTMKEAGFIVSETFIEGRDRTAMIELESALNLKKGMPMTQVDLSQMHDRLQVLPWIKSVQIKRQLPNVLYINIQERKPIALWQEKGKHYPLDEDGNVIHASADELSYLMITVGPDAPEYTPELVRELEKYPDLYRRVASAVRIGNRRWNLILDDVSNGMKIYLPEENVMVALERLNKLNTEYQLLNRQLSLIDLRLPDRLIVQTMDQKPIQPLNKVLPFKVNGGSDD